MPVVMTTSERQYIEASHGLPVWDHRTGDENVEGTKKIFKRVFVMGRRKEIHVTLFDEKLTKPCPAGRKRAGLHTRPPVPVLHRVARVERIQNKHASTRTSSREE
jgi:hypothetical protein